MGILQLLKTKHSLLSKKMASEGNKSSTKIIEKCRISPPPGSVPPTQLPLTFFDLHWLMLPPFQVLFFYQLPQPTQDLFTTTLIPNLKHSLSLSLRHFFPFAATATLPPPPHKPYLDYTHNSFVSLTIAESSADFNNLIANNAREATELLPLAPKLSHPQSDKAHNYVFPVFELQVTIFPNYGFCIGFMLHHMAADGRSIAQFLKSWASICSGGAESPLLEQAPSHDRTVITKSQPSHVIDSQFLESAYSWVWKKMEDTSTTVDTDVAPLDGIVRATFLMGRVHIQRLKNWLSAQFMAHKETETLRVSSFVVTSAYVWVHLFKSRAIGVETTHDICYFPLIVDCRNRKGFEFPVPATYFGNCLAMCMLRVKKSELVGENGFFAAAKAIATRIKELEKGALREADKWILDFVEAYESGNMMILGGSPNFGLYGLDFGWGRPKKIDIFGIDTSGCIVLADTGEEEGGIEIGMGLHKDKMDAFAASFHHGFKLLAE